MADHNVLGARGERIAKAYLEQLGYKIIALNLPQICKQYCGNFIDLALVVGFQTAMLSFERKEN